MSVTLRIVHIPHTKIVGREWNVEIRDQNGHYEYLDFATEAEAQGWIDKAIHTSPNDEKMYFKFCYACNCYEYDCHGEGLSPGCIKDQPGYTPAHTRARNRAKQAERALQRMESRDTNNRWW
jgi:hypothetical protein